MRKLSDVLEEVAHDYETGAVSGYSCCRVAEAIENELNYRLSLEYIDKFVYVGFEEMGCSVKAFRAYDDMDFYTAQQARSIWLTWAAMMAREQGL